jgi:molybdopterin/thiamine biosynthesis adenylyltransferase
VDALDNIPDRFVLEEAARSLGIPLIHGALAGFNGQVMTIFPEDPGLALLYGTKAPAAQDPGRAEALLGVPAPTPSAVATVQAMEVVKILLNRGRLLRNQMLHIDLEAARFEVFKF